VRKGVDLQGSTPKHPAEKSLLPEGGPIPLLMKGNSGGELKKKTRKGRGFLPHRQRKKASNRRKSQSEPGTASQGKNGAPQGRTPRRKKERQPPTAKKEKKESKERKRKICSPDGKQSRNTCELHILRGRKPSRVGKRRNPRKGGGKKSIIHNS